MSGIALIGPMGCGKSVVGTGLAERLARPHVELDDLRWDYYDEAGFDHELARTFEHANNQRAILEYSKPFEVHAVERATADFPGAVISFGAGHSVHGDETLLQRVRDALRDWVVILLLPDVKAEVSLAVLDERLARIDGFPVDLGRELNEWYLGHPSNERLATATVVTRGRSVADVVTEIAASLLSDPR